MIKEARGFGNTIDEAKEKAIADLHASEEDDIQFEVIATPKKKTLGLFGGRKAEVRVFVEIPDEKPKFQKKAPQKSPKKENKPAKKADKPIKAEVAKNEEAAPAPKKDIYEGYSELRDAAEIDPNTNAGRAITYLKTILASLGCTKITAKVAEKENAAIIELDGEGMNVIIGHRGEVLDALQYLTSLASNNGGAYYKVSLNIGNFRQKREEVLINLANKIAAQVLKTGKNRTLEPMNPYERRIIHTAIQNVEGVVSASFGEGTSRRVVIGLEGSELRPMRRDNGKRSNYPRRRLSAPKSAEVAAPAREPKRDSDIPLYGKIN